MQPLFPQPDALVVRSRHATGLEHFDFQKKSCANKSSPKSQLSNKMNNLYRLAYTDSDFALKLKPYTFDMYQILKVSPKMRALFIEQDANMKI